MIKPINEYPHQRMTDVQTRCLFSMILSDGEEDEEMKVAVGNDFVCKVVTSRLEWAGVSVFTPSLLAFISILAQGNPGRGLMLAHACVQGNAYNISAIIELFPNGVPTDASYDKCWDDQKVNGANGVDMIANWQKVFTVEKENSLT